MLNTDDSQPVDPAPVVISTPLDDCASAAPRDADAVARQNVRARADEQIVEGEQPLAVVERDLGQGDGRASQPGLRAP